MEESTKKSVIGKFIEQVEKIKEVCHNIYKNRNKFEIVFRAPSNIEGINEFIEFIKKEHITENSLKSFLKSNNKLKSTNKLKEFILNFINDDEFKTKNVNNLYKFWIKYENSSLFKNKNFIGNERLIYKDFLASNPDKFNNMTTFDILTKMRHYEVPNRLLDVTFDPLLALYFACGGEDNIGSGIVFIYAVNDKNIKYYDSDTVRILSVLTKLKKHYKEQLKQIVDIFKNKNGDYYKSEDNINICYNAKNITFDGISMKIDEKECKFEYSKKLSRMIIECDNKQIDINKIKSNNNNNNNKETINVKKFFNYLISKIIGELTWQLKQEIPGWYEHIFDLETFTECYLVKPKMNNPRIIAQSGAFFIYPFEGINVRKTLFYSDIFRINVSKTKEELLLLNIKGTKYMPDDLTVYAREIKKNYSSKSRI